METMTVKQLFESCKNLCKGGFGDRKIIISGDDEGNEFHELFYGFSQGTKGKEISYGLPFGVTAEKFDKEYILLG